MVKVSGRGSAKSGARGGPWQRRVWCLRQRQKFVHVSTLNTPTNDTSKHTRHKMDAPSRSTTSSLFEVYLRLRPSFAPNAERFLDVDAANDKAEPTHITIHPPALDQRRKAVETFKFTRVFEEEATQLDLFHGTGLNSMMQGVLGAEGREGRDGLFATLGVTGSGKVWTYAMLLVREEG
jgi:hypothetical protein